MAEENTSNTNHQNERETLFANESFAIGILQAVSGAAVVAAIEQHKNIQELCSMMGFLVFLTFITFGLIGAVLSGYYKHEYKMWGVKKNASKCPCEQKERELKETTSLNRMRFFMRMAVYSVVLSLLLLLITVWSKYLGIF